jgi:uncharacterized protein involved in outer membrane biogenesis
MRKLLIIACAAILAIAAALAVAVMRVNAYLRAHQADLAARASAALERPVSFDTIGVALGLGLDVEVANLRIADDPVDGGGDLVRAGSVSASIDPLAALLGEVRVRRVVLNAPVITVTRTTAGFNFDSIGRRRESTAAISGTANAATEAIAPAGSHTTRESFRVVDGAIRDGTMRYVDRRTDPPVEIVLTALDVNAHDLGPTGAARFTLRAALDDAARQTLTARGALSTLPGAALDLHFEADGLFLDHLLRLPETAALLPAKLTTNDPIHVELALSGTRRRPHLQLDADATAAAVRYAALLNKPPGVRLSLTAAGEFDAPTRAVTIESADINLASLAARLSGTLQSGDPPTIDLGVRVAPLQLAELAAVVPLLSGRQPTGVVAADLRATGALPASGLPNMNGRIDLQNVSLGSPDLPGHIGDLSAPIIFTGDSATLATTAVTVGDSPARLGCRAAPLAAATVTCSLNVDELAPQALGIAAMAGDQLDAVAIDAVLDTAAEPHASQIALRAGGGRIRRVPFRNLRAAAHAHDGEYRIERATADALGGGLEVEGTYWGARQGPPAFELHGRVRNVRLRDLLASQGVERVERVDGHLHGDVTLAGSGYDRPAVGRSLRGHGRVDITDGVVRDVDLAEEGLGVLKGLVSSRARKRHPELFGGDLQFEQASATFDVAGRRVTTSDARLRAADVSASARGGLDFDGRLDLRGLLTLSPALTGDLFGGSTAVRYLSGASSGVDIDFTVGGTLEKPKLRAGGALLADAVGRGIGDLVGGGAEGAGDLLEGIEGLIKR